MLPPLRSPYALYVAQTWICAQENNNKRNLHSESQSCQSPELRVPRRTVTVPGASHPHSGRGTRLTPGPVEHVSGRSRREYRVFVLRSALEEDGTWTCVRPSRAPRLRPLCALQTQT
ncbi:unnamed protein product [Knipowitschia caucasica]|uniref:Uncharacterized protein n=1 Tax=Knipowitschia caucasica TaxID=637954 RepID=A0AAV2M1E5_KNICA